MVGLSLLLLQGCQTVPPSAEPTPPRAPTLNLSAAKCVAPKQPEPAVVGGTTRLQYTVDASGKVTRVEVVQSAGDTEAHKRLDRQSVSYLSSCVFPASPGAADVVQKIEFEYVL
jgi:protein TonB